MTCKDYFDKDKSKVKKYLQTHAKSYSFEIFGHPDYCHCVCTQRKSVTMKNGLYCNHRSPEVIQTRQIIFMNCVK